MRSSWWCLTASMLMAVASVGLIGCASSPTPSPVEPAIQLRYLQESTSCPAAAAPLPMTLRIDAAAGEDVVAVTPDGRPYHVWWAEGFQGGTASDPVVRDPSGQVVARDGELLTEYALHGHLVCATGDSIYVLLDGPR